jgi:hypothetical protein
LIISRSTRCFRYSRAMRRGELASILRKALFAVPGGVTGAVTSETLLEA